MTCKTPWPGGDVKGAPGRLPLLAHPCPGSPQGRIGDAGNAVPALAGTTARGTATSPQMLFEKLRRPAPGEFGGLAVMHGLPLLVDEGVLGVIAK